MRLAVTKRLPTDCEDRKRRDARAAFGRLLSLVLSALLVFQLAGTPAFATPSAPSGQSTEAAALASLSAAIGHTVSLCDHGDPGRPGNPATPNDCQHCICCRFTAGGVALAPADASAICPTRVVAAIARPVVVFPFVRTPAIGSATPRGPPALT